LFPFCLRFTSTFIETINSMEFWQRGISAGNFALSLLMMFAPVPGAMALGFMLANLIVWLTPPARRTLDAEARDYPGTSLRDAMRGLAKVCLWTLPAGLCSVSRRLFAELVAMTCG
jgi:hypothetical protein